jgi:Protein of unknown function (DUF3179)
LFTLEVEKVMKPKVNPWVLVLCLLALGSFCMFLVPAFVIRPFRYQSSRALTLAIAVRSFAPVITLILSVAIVIIAVFLWRQVSLLGRSLTVIALLLGVGSAVMARQNYFEWMFHPISDARFLPASNAKLGGKEMVMTLEIGGEARAYPILQMAYHHILNDTVAGTLVVVTY